MREANFLLNNGRLDLMRGRTRIERSFFSREGHPASPFAFPLRSAHEGQCPITNGTTDIGKVTGNGGTHYTWDPEHGNFLMFLFMFWFIVVSGSLLANNLIFLYNIQWVHSVFYQTALIPLTINHIINIVLFNDLVYFLAAPQKHIPFGWRYPVPNGPLFRNGITVSRARFRISIPAPVSKPKPHAYRLDPGHDPTKLFFFPWT